MISWLLTELVKIHFNSLLLINYFYMNDKFFKNGFSAGIEGMISNRVGWC